MTATLTRTVLGRQAAYGNYAIITTYRGVDVFDTQDWEANNPISVIDSATTQLRGTLRLQLSATGSFSAYAVEAAIADVADCYIQMVNEMASSSNGAYSATTGDIRAGIALRGSAVVANTLPTDVISVISPGPTSTNSSPSNRAEINERIGAVSIQAIRTVGDVRQNFPARIHAILTGTTIAANNAGGSPSWSLSATGLAGPSGRPGLIAYNAFISVRYFYVGGYYRCSSKNLIVNGPTAGTWYVELLDKDDNVLHTSSVQSSGQVVVDYEAAALLLPLTQKIRITDGVSPLVTVYPDNGVWPGDTWTYADDPTPSGIVTRTAAGLVMARLPSYVTTGLSITQHSTGDWTPWSSTGATNLSSVSTVTTATAPYFNDLGTATSSFTAPTRKGVRWIGSESIPSDAFLVATARVSIAAAAASLQGVFLRSGTAPQTARVGGVLAVTGTSPQQHDVEELNAGTTSQAVSVSGATQVNRRNRFALWVRSTIATFRAVVFRQVSGPTVVSETLTGLASPPPTAGLALNFASSNSGMQAWWQGIAVMTSAEITMSGPASGWAWGLRVRDASGMVVAESGANVAGVATLNTQTEMDAAYGRYSISVMRSIEAYDTVTGDTLSDVLVPSGGIWGGDTFTVTSLPPAGDGNRARITRRKAGAQQLLIKR